MAKWGFGHSGGYRQVVLSASPSFCELISATGMFSKRQGKDTSSQGREASRLGSVRGSATLQ